MQEVGKCDICKAPIHEAAYLCREHYLLKEAAYGVWDLTHEKPERFKEWAIKRLLEYVQFKMENDKYVYPPHVGFSDPTNKFAVDYDGDG